MNVKFPNDTTKRFFDYVLLLVNFLAAHKDSGRKSFSFRLLEFGILNSESGIAALPRRVEEDDSELIQQSSPARQKGSYVFKTRSIESASRSAQLGASGWQRLALLLSVACLTAPGWAQQQSQQQQQQNPQGQPPSPQTHESQPAQPANQQSPVPPKISVSVKVVNVLATVRNKHGEIVRNLTKDDFVLEEDDRAQNIAYFSRETDLPLTLGLLVDTSGSQRRVLDQERSASSAFLDQVLRLDKDRAFVIHFDHEVELLQDLTSSRQKLEAALALLQAPQFGHESQEGGGNSPDSNPGSGQGSGRRGGGHGWGGGTLLYDAVYLASNELMKKQQGRKALIVLSDGVDRGSKETLASAVEAAQRADTLVYSILFTSEQPYGGGYGGRGMGGGGMGRRGGGGWPGRYPQQSRPDGKKVLEQISKQTGGRLFEVSKKLPIEQIYSQIQDELRNQYSLGYTPDPPDTGAGYHKIRLTAKPKDLVVQARDGYYSTQ